MCKEKICRIAAAEGSVLLKNEGNLLPFKSGTKLAVFGRAQTFYYKSGTGSGGLVHINKEPCIIESLKENNDLILDKDLIEIYQNWVNKNPFNNGTGAWASEPWFQEEMPVDEELVKTVSYRNDAAVIVIARTAGEDHDNAAQKGSFLLIDKEEKLLEVVTKYFDKVVVALNVGNIIDLSFMDKYPINSLLYIWQGGEEGANAFSDILSGKLAPSGKLTDTIAKDISDYPSTANFGDCYKNVYKEDVFVGYRYFETFAKERVKYPFGFGLTYTSFDIKYSAIIENDTITVTANVTNVGENCGKEVIQVYYNVLESKIGVPKRQLIAFAKTRELKPSETEILNIIINIDDLSSYDECGITGNKSCYVLESGNYEIFVGTDVRSAEKIFEFSLSESKVVAQLKQINPPIEAFEKLCANGEYSDAHLSSFDLNERVANNRPKDIIFTGNKGIKLKDVFEGQNSLDEFIAQLTDEELAMLCVGEGMNSPKATPGTVGALGGLTEGLSNYGIPVCCVTDGPSGMRMDDGKIATLAPNGTSLACTWDVKLVEETFDIIGKELKEYNVDALLGPGINIHRNPLCGRNFEYLSEDPYLTGKMAVAITKGIAKYGAYSTIKHFCCNNQETRRFDNESVVSERALREIYLKPFEIAVKQGENVLIMTSYNLVNGYWSASNYDINHTVLRDEWGFENFVMTDWWTKCNTNEKGVGSKEFLQSMIRAENDIYMVAPDAVIKMKSIIDGLNQGYITRCELQRSAKNILRWILKTNTYKDYLQNDCVPKYPITVSDENMDIKYVIESPKREAEYEVGLNSGMTILNFSLLCDADSLAQNTISLKLGEIDFSFSVCGTEGETVEIKRSITIDKADIYKLVISHADVIKIMDITIRQ